MILPFIILYYLSSAEKKTKKISYVQCDKSYDKDMHRIIWEQRGGHVCQIERSGNAF